ncbi:MAG: glutathione S-transferase family protein [Gomphosphaeria aponina SAG 52.96 = DSM 107014]|uniref:Glutathione S-transferase family protein n=1 Tax=Gomphosphaeria aponina SAG 52.96 = DSM 107014 TaxID=1521640 RepID=A0A941JSM1_9CHRO|nr:glutathione S-transferase family protein [Gomphosphaeria aponina SAG 52.96 = DSM 107014]
MLLLQFSTSHYCRKARLALGFKQIDYRVENLTPGKHIFQLKPLTGLTTVPVLLPEKPGEPAAIADSTRIFAYLEQYAPQPSFYPEKPTQARLLEDWLDESIGTATRFVYYDFRAGAGKSIDPSLASKLLINLVSFSYGITPATVQLAKARLKMAMEVLSVWENQPYLIGDGLSVADLTAAALLSPLALIPEYYQTYPWLFTRIREIHLLCGETLPPGLQ